MDWTITVSEHLEVEVARKLHDSLARCVCRRGGVWSIIHCHTATLEAACYVTDDREEHVRTGVVIVRY